MKNNSGSPSPGLPFLTIAAILLGVFQAAKFFFFINKYSVDIPFWDQWGFYNAFFEHHSLWDIFSWQHGPHRQGIGFLLTWLVNELSGWDQRAQCFMIGGVILSAAIAALWLKRRLTGSLHWYDVVPAIIILSTKQFEIYAGTPNVSHGALPLLLILLLCISWTIKQFRLRYACVVLINFLAVFTGFGLFVGFITPLLLIVDCYHTFHSRDWRRFRAALLAVAFALASIALFYYRYKFQPAVDCFCFPDPKWYLYPVFMAIEFAGIILPGHAASIVGVIAGTAGLAGLLGIFGISGYRLLLKKNDSAINRVVFFLISFSLFFAANCAVGRLCLGLHAALSSRYVPLLMPAVIGAYLFLIHSSQWPGRNAIMLFLLCIFLVSALPAWQIKPQKTYAQGKTAWILAYRKTSDIALADSISGFKIYPDPSETDLDRKLQWLREHHYSFFRKMQ